MEKPSIKEIIERKNDKDFITRISFHCEFTTDEMRELKNILIFENIFFECSQGRRTFDNNLLDELIEEGIVDLNNSYMRFKVVSAISEKWIIEKYKKYFTIREIGWRKILTPRELIRIFGKPQVGETFARHYNNTWINYTVIESNPKLTSMVIKVNNEFELFNEGIDLEQNILTVKLSKNGEWIDKYKGESSNIKEFK